MVAVYDYHTRQRLNLWHWTFRLALDAIPAPQAGHGTLLTTVSP
jgi:hypothetical protein